jgi:hypothetical protein
MKINIPEDRFEEIGLNLFKLQEEDTKKLTGDQAAESLESIQKGISLFNQKKFDESMQIYKKVDNKIKDAQKDQPIKWVSWIAGSIGIVFVIVILYKSWDMSSMANPEYARGIISYLIVLAFIILGVLMILAALFGPFQDDKRSDASFRRAREIFMSIVGIVGTIVGFYYGATTTGSVSLELLAKTIDSNLVIQASGGARPYRISIKSDGKPLDLRSDKGFEIIDICKLSKPADNKLVIEIIDAKNQKDSQDYKIEYDKLCAKLQTEIQLKPSTPSKTTAPTPQKSEGQ